MLKGGYDAGKLGLRTSGAVGQLPAWAGMSFTRSSAKQKWKRVYFSLCQPVEPEWKQPPDPVFPYSQKNVNLFKQNQNFLAKEK